jgi:large subunit ribosomal protein L24
MNKVHVKTGDKVIILSGASKGKRGKVVSVMPKDMTVIVEGVNMATKHKKPKKQTDPGGIIHQEAPIKSSKVMLICPKCSEPTKVAMEILDNGEKFKKCKKCGELIDRVSKEKF